MKIYLDPFKMQEKQFNFADCVSDGPVQKNGYIFLLKKPDGSDFSETDYLYGPALIVSEPAP